MAEKYTDDFDLNEKLNEWMKWDRVRLEIPLTHESRQSLLCLF